MDKNRYLFFVDVLAVAAGVITTLIINNQKYKDERGFGFSQKISITFQEDSLIIADHELWRGSLLVIANNNETKDTLIARKVTDEYRDSTLYIPLDSAKTVHVILTFAKSLNYEFIDRIFTIGELTDSPNVKLPIHKILPPQIEYSSRVVTNIDGKEYNIQEAIIIIRDKIQRTDINGNFTFKLSDSLNLGDVIYIVKKVLPTIKESSQVCLTEMDASVAKSRILVEGLPSSVHIRTFLTITATSLSVVKAVYNGRTQKCPSALHCVLGHNRKENTSVSLPVWQGYRSSLCTLDMRSWDSPYGHLRVHNGP